MGKHSDIILIRIGRGSIMFENALIRRAGVEGHIDLGLLAETLFFYNSVHLLLDRGSVIALAKKIPGNDLIALFERNNIKLSYLRQGFGVLSSGLPTAHDFGAFTFHGTETGGKISDHKEEILFTLERELGTSSQTRKLATAIADRSKLHRFANLPEKEKSVSDLARADAEDGVFLEKAVASLLRNLVPSYELASGLRFKLLKVKGGYAIDTNLNFDKINAIYHQVVLPTHSSISPAYLLAHIQDARVDTYFSAHYMAELVTTPVYSDIIQLKHFDFLRRREANANEIDYFHELIVPDFPTIRERINEGGTSVSDLMKLLDQAEKFKAWLHSANPDERLVYNYHRAATQATWADKLPTKATRFAVATGIGIALEAYVPTGVGTVGGLGIGALDSFYLDRFIKGWRPNQFIEGPYKDFVAGKK